MKFGQAEKKVAERKQHDGERAGQMRDGPKSRSLWTKFCFLSPAALI